MRQEYHEGIWHEMEGYNSACFYCQREFPCRVDVGAEPCEVVFDTTKLHEDEHGLLWCSEAHALLYALDVAHLIRGYLTEMINKGDAQQAASVADRLTSFCRAFEVIHDILPKAVLA